MMLFWIGHSSNWSYSDLITTNKSKHVLILQLHYLANTVQYNIYIRITLCRMVHYAKQLFYLLLLESSRNEICQSFKSIHHLLYFFFSLCWIFRSKPAMDFLRSWIDFGLLFCKILLYLPRAKNSYLWPSRFIFKNVQFFSFTHWLFL